MKYLYLLLFALFSHALLAQNNFVVTVSLDSIKTRVAIPATATVVQFTKVNTANTGKYALLIFKNSADTKGIKLTSDKLKLKRDTLVAIKRNSGKRLLFDRSISSTAQIRVVCTGCGSGTSSKPDTTNPVVTIPLNNTTARVAIPATATAVQFTNFNTANASKYALRLFDSPIDPVGKAILNKEMGLGGDTLVPIKKNGQQRLLFDNAVTAIAEVRVIISSKRDSTNEDNQKENIKPDFKFELSAPSGSCVGNCVPRMNYDFRCQTFTMYKPNGTPLKVDRTFLCLKLGRRKTIHPRIDEPFLITGTNFDPYRDSMAVTYKSFDRNMEGLNSFSRLLTSGTSVTSSTGATTPKSNPEETKSEAANSLKEEQKKTFTNLASALEKYLVNRPAPSVCQVELDIAEFNRLAEEAGLGNSLAKWLNTGKAIGVEEGVLKRIETAYKALTSYKVLSIPAFQIQHADLSELTFTIHRKNAPVATRTFTLANSGGFKIDFSAGIGATGLLDEAFTTVAKSATITSTTLTTTVTNGVSTTGLISATSVTSEDIITKRNEGDFRLGLITLAHAYVRTGWRVNLAFTGGFMIDNNIATRYLVGGSLLCGREQRLIITYGLTYGKVKRLDDGLELGKPYVYSSSGARTIPTRDMTERSWFFGITYNLGSL